MAAVNLHGGKTSMARLQQEQVQNGEHSSWWQADGPDAGASRYNCDFPLQLNEVSTQGDIVNAKTYNAIMKVNILFIATLFMLQK